MSLKVTVSVESGDFKDSIVLSDDDIKALSHVMPKSTLGQNIFQIISNKLVELKSSAFSQLITDWLPTMRARQDSLPTSNSGLIAVITEQEDYLDFEDKENANNVETVTDNSSNPDAN